jgi:hypothetical protein
MGILDFYNHNVSPRAYSKVPWNASNNRIFMILLYVHFQGSLDFYLFLRSHLSIVMIILYKSDHSYINMNSKTIGETLGGITNVLVYPSITNVLVYLGITNVLVYPSITSCLYFKKVSRPLPQFTLIVW